MENKYFAELARRLNEDGISTGEKNENENIDTGKMSSEQVTQIYGAFSQMESTNHSANMRISMRLRMENGAFPPSSIPYGYRLDVEARELKILPEEADVVRYIYAAYLGGQGKQQSSRAT